MTRNTTNGSRVREMLSSKNPSSTGQCRKVNMASIIPHPNADPPQVNDDGMPEYRRTRDYERQGKLENKNHRQRSRNPYERQDDHFRKSSSARNPSNGDSNFDPRTPSSGDRQNSRKRRFNRRTPSSDNHWPWSGGGVSFNGRDNRNDERLNDHNDNRYGDRNDGGYKYCRHGRSY